VSPCAVFMLEIISLITRDGTRSTDGWQDL